MTTTQNVACPTMIAGIPNEMNETASTIDESARAVTMPGRAIGRTSANEIVSRPKNRKRWIANAARLPSSNANVVAKTPAIREFRTAAQILSSCHATENQCSVHRSGGKDGIRALLKE